MANNEFPLETLPAAGLYGNIAKRHGYKMTHLLSLPIEIWDRIVHFVHQDTLESRIVSWTAKPKTAYDGLQLVCRQIRHELQTSDIMYAVNQHRLLRLLSIPRNKLTYLSTRSLNVEVALDMPKDQCLRLASVLHALQLSLQELRLVFIGKDKDNRALSIHGCAMYPRKFDGEEGQLLSYKGQNTMGHQLSVLSQLPILRNLRVLVVHNANLPLTQGMLIINKPKLEALSVMADPRSILHSFKDLPKTSPIMLSLFSRPQDPAKLPRVRALDIGTNAALTSWLTARQLRPFLEHLSWTVTPPDLQASLPAEERKPFDFYSATGALMQLLVIYAPRLTTLRMCLGVNKDKEGRRCDNRYLEAALEAYLPRYHGLRNFEIHHTQQDDWIGPCVVRSLPKQLRRLYISDDAIDAECLVALITRRYFANSDDDDALVERHMSELSLCHTNEQSRTDYIPLNTGQLGFVTFLFKDNDSAQSEAIRHKILKLNGRLLDREHNMHLLQEDNCVMSRGIPPKLATASIKNGANGLSEATNETASTSDHLQIAATLASMELSQEASLVNHYRLKCEENLPDLDTSDSDVAAEEIFKLEQVACPTQQVCKPGIDVVDVSPSNKCCWMSPDYEVPAVGTFPSPSLPKDWQTDARR